ncbi:hypothetical protein HNR14_001163 [Leifsonia naganoensis]|uniref:Right handed beta helix domain-containing protein n=1 Tax=Leifsonia naganoensis TaxID=150025 RepID=A0A853DJB0_9MICO|nr:hypothetical protein [Leifsonia naganoensis]NYK09282.1 hypothetical protein [Leifsonia naganoensis]
MGSTLLARTATAATAAVALIAGLLGAAQPANGAPATPAAPAATGTAHYIDNRSGSNCSDTGAGTSTTAPWCSFAPAASLTLGAGDSLLLARGASWSERLVVALHGSAAAPATLGAYGTGAAPRILFNDSAIGVDLTDPDHAVVSGLDIGAKTAAGTSALSYGLMVTYTSPGHDDLTLSDLSVHDNRIVGLFVRNTANTTNAQTVLDGVTISRVTSTHNGHGIVLTNQGAVTDIPTPQSPGNSGSNVFAHVLVDGIHQTADDNNNPPVDEVFSQIDAGCPDSLAISSASNVTVRNSILDGSAACRTGAGTAALFLGNVNHAIVANNMMVNTPNTGNPDMVAIDHEATTSDVTIAGNYFADNYGGAIEYLAIHGPNDFSTGNTATANVFLRNGVSHAIPYPGDGAIAQVGGSIATDATISDNLAFEPYGLLTAQLGGDVTHYTSTNNIATDSADDISQAAAQFGANGTPWGYQRISGGSWKALPYDTASSSYTASGVTVGRFALTPSATSDAGITWTAPRSGVISLRGYPLALSGTAAVKVTVNGTAVATATIDTVGAVLKADDVTVHDGDVVRFSVAAGSAPVSWVPAVAYSSKATSSDGKGEWTFSVAGDAQGWSSSAPAQIHRGLADISTAGGTTTLDSAAGLKLSAAASSSLRLRYYNGTAATSGTVYFTTASGQSFTAERSVPFSINPRSTAGVVEGFQSVLVPLAGNAAWTGTIDRIRIAITGASGTFAVDSVQLTKPQTTGWEFDTASGWTAKSNVSCATTGTASASPTVDVDNTAGGFSQYADINWTMTRMQTFPVSTPRLAQVDFWAFKTGDPQGCLYFRIVKITDPATHRGDTLFTGAVPASAVSTDGGFVSVYPGLTGLDTAATYGLEIFNPYVVPGGGNFGVAYSDDGSRPMAGREFYSVNNNGTWNGPEGARSLKFRTYTAATIAAQNPTEGYAPVTVADGAVQGSGGYEPALLSPGKLGITASGTRYIHIRMSNPTNQPVAYLLFTTNADPAFDQPGDGSPPPEESGKGYVFSLLPGADFHEYTLDMSTVAGWTGTVQQLMVQPANRWNYRINDLSSTWSGKIDYIRLDSGTTAAAAGTASPPATGPAAALAAALAAIVAALKDWCTRTGWCAW